MNKIAKLMIAILIIMYCTQYLAGQSNPDALSGDMGFKMSANSNYKMQITMTCASIPFEGLTNPRNQFKPFNRVGKVQNGSLWRFFSSQGTIGAERNIYKISSNILNYNEVFDLMHSSGSEYESSINYVYGYAKYLVEVLIYYNNIETERYRYFYNTLDSKFGGKDTISNTTYYIGDLYVEYNITLPLNRRLEIYKDVRSGPAQGLIPIDTISTADTLIDGTPTKEVKVWEQKYPPSSFPVEQNFYASTTPFGLRPEVFYENAQKTEILIGTRVVFDSVYNNKDIGSLKKDTIGYNTRDDNAYHRYYTLPPVGFNNSGNTYTTTSWFNDFSGIQKGLTLIADSSTTLEFKKNKKLWVSGIGDENIYDVLILKENSKIIHFENTGLYTFNYGKIIDEGCNITWAQNTIHRAFYETEFVYNGSEHIVNNGGKVQIDSSATLTLGNNTVLTFDGSNTNLELKPYSIVKLGQNAKIVFKNGAYLIANGSNISSLPNKQGWGIELINSGEQTVITNCYFTNLTRALYFNNTDAGHANLLRNISGNTFTGNANCMMLLGTNNTNAIHVMNNNFNMSPSIGFGVFMGFNSGSSGNEATGASYYLYFQGNSFVNGNVSALFWSETSNYPFITFKYNTITGSTNNTNLLLRQISGDFKNNSIVNNSGFNFDIRQSSPNILSNTMTSPNLNILNTAAYPIMAPVSNNSSDGGWIWKGGNNDITSNYNDNVNYDNGNILLDWGQNCFLKGTNKKHLIGGIDEPEPYSYMVRNNDFNNSNMPVYALYYYYNINQTVTPNAQGSSFGCNNSTDLGTVWQINDLGNGIYDTVFKSNNTSGYQPQPDEANYSTATIKMAQEMHFVAISYFKTLINNYPTSSYTDACLYKLYECYVNLDTSGNQSIRDILFNDLRNYLNNKILSGIYSNEFNNIAYNITVMCEAYIGNYNEALEGYEFISLYHPDMYIRLLASWDYAEILELLNGPGGISSKELYMTNKEYLSHITKRINKLAANDPVKKKVKKSFLKMKEDRKIAIEKDIMTKTKDDKTMKISIAKLQKEDQKIENRVIKVLRYAKTMSEDEKRKQQMEDILLSRYNGNISSEVLETKTPGSYELSQNYPNPFNPVTKINFALPKQGFVSLKIYDITGREIQTLVNDVKQAGYYSVDFNGSQLSSGVYFYMIKSGDFVMTKRMVLIK